ncbi:MAG: DinB family protein [Euryarchaeota archaeon]|nr:DinB family protein [Euryarchaeota archaeon]MDE1835498.1 DinB family protein [Euryarchaeota archaeon]MDE1880391.1 DinB family protein [Euryarchaeota archaeon]MDE2045779.1 DinB family protein [Thermoplasmata archaeon]
MTGPARASVKFYRDLFRYNHQVIENFLRKLEHLPKKAAERDRGIGHLSLARTLLHVVRVHDAWLNYIVRGNFAGLHESHERFARLRTVKDARAYFGQSWKGIDRFLGELTPSELRRSARAPWMPGRYTVEDVLVQCTLEQAHHVGEMIGAFWQQDIVPPQMMFIPLRTGKRVSVA